MGDFKKTVKSRKKRIVPCLDIRGGKVVKGINFDGIREVGDPVEFAKKYNAAGADELVLYDISASVENRIIDLDIVKNVKSVIDVSLCVAGGIGTIEDFEKVLAAGADKVSLNSLAVKNKSFIKEAADKFGTKSIVIGIDAMQMPNDKQNEQEKKKYNVMLKMGKEDTGIDLIDWAKTVESLGAGEICLNSIDCDGVKNGYDIDMLRAICESVNIPIIASGGAGKLEHFSEVFEKTDVDAALGASVFHYDILTVDEIKKYLKI